jgi:hypothetical protein
MSKRTKPDVCIDELIDDLADEEGPDGMHRSSSTLGPSVIAALRRGRHIEPKPTLDELDCHYD